MGSSEGTSDAMILLIGVQANVKSIIALHTPQVTKASLVFALN